MRNKGSRKCLKIQLMIIIKVINSNIQMIMIKTKIDLAVTAEVTIEEEENYL